MSAILLFGLIALTLASVSVFRGYIFSPNKSLELIPVVQPSINALRKCHINSLDFFAFTSSIAGVTAASREDRQQFSFEKHPKGNMYRIVYLGIKNQKWYLSYTTNCKESAVFWSKNAMVTATSYFEITPSKTGKVIYTLRAVAKDQACTTRHLGISKTCSDTVVKLYPSSFDATFEFALLEFRP